MISHADIATRIAAIEAEQAKVVARDAKERASLQELCGGIGHKFGEPGVCIEFTHLEDSVTRRGHRHKCDVCGFAEWTGDVVVEPTRSGEYVFAQVPRAIEAGLARRLADRFGLKGKGGLIV